MSIDRWKGSAKGRNKAVRHGGIVYTVATAGAAGADIKAQTRGTLEIIENSLNEAGSDKTRMLSAQIFLADMSQKEGMDEVWNEWIGDDWNTWPQRACVGAPLAGGPRRIGRGFTGERDVPPPLRTVHVDCHLRGPHPVVLGMRLAGDLVIGIPHHVEQPVDAGEVHPPDIPGLGRARRGPRERCERGPGDRDLDGPAAIHIRGIVQGPVHVNAAYDAVQVVPAVHGAAIAVRALEVELPDRLECVHLELVVVMVVSVGIEEDLEVRIVEDD